MGISAMTKSTPLAGGILLLASGLGISFWATRNIVKTNGAAERATDLIPIVPQSKTFIPQITSDSSSQGTYCDGNDNLKTQVESDQLEAVFSLALAGTFEAIHKMATLIVSLPPGDRREEVVRLGSSVANPEAVPAALELLQSADDPGVIRMSQEIFSRLADEEAVQGILDIYDSSNDLDLRNRLESTIASISTEDASRALMFVVSDTAMSARDGMILASAQALRQIGTPPAVDALIERLDSEQTEEGRSLIAVEVAEIRNPLAEASLQNAALGQSRFATQAQTRIAAISTLRHYPSGETQELLLSLSADSDHQVSAAAIESLLEIKKQLNK